MINIWLHNGLVFIESVHKENAVILSLTKNARLVRVTHMCIYLPFSIAYRDKLDNNNEFCKQLKHWEFSDGKVRAAKRRVLE